MKIGSDRGTGVSPVSLTAILAVNPAVSCAATGETPVGLMGGTPMPRFHTRSKTKADHIDRQDHKDRNRAQKTGSSPSLRARPMQSWRPFLAAPFGHGEGRERGRKSSMSPYLPPYLPLFWEK